MRLDRQICIVTGAGGTGIGAAIAGRFVAEGATVVVCDIDGACAEAVAGSLGERAVPWEADVTSSVQVEGMVRAAIDRFGRLDVMVNNVGFTLPGFIGELADDGWHSVLDGNLSSTFYGIRAALRPMRAQKSGSIINISSAAGTAGAPGLGAYGAAKAGVINLTQTAAVENFRGGVRVNCILPNAATKAMLTWLDTTEAGRKTRASIEDYARCGTPDEIASAALFLASPESAYVNGVALPVDGGLASRVACINAKID